MTIYKILLGNNKSKELHKNLLHSIETNIEHLPYTNKYRQTCMYDKINKYECKPTVYAQYVT